jgi:hypothetical protein
MKKSLCMVYCRTKPYSDISSIYKSFLCTKTHFEVVIKTFYSDSLCGFGVGLYYRTSGNHLNATGNDRTGKVASFYLCACA